MRRAERLFQIIQILRAHRGAVTGKVLADELEISLRTLYRDMAELMAQRVPITGEAGTGYVLEDGYDMPALMLTPDELEAAALGATLVAAQADPSLARAARDLVTKLSASIPEELRPIVLDAGVRSVAPAVQNSEAFDGAELRQAIRTRSKLALRYVDQKEVVTDRVIWPLLIAYLGRVRYIVGWCETRQGLRNFRTDRVRALTALADRYPARRKQLLDEWDRQIAKRYRARSDGSDMG